MNTGEYEAATGEIYTKDEIDKFILKEQNYFIEYVEKYWLNRYFKVLLMNESSRVPTIISSPDDSTENKTRFRKGVVEEYQIKAIRAEDWLEIFQREIEKLPNDYRDIITLKYLRRRGDGRPYGDEVIRPQMNIDRNKYYEIKREALEELGRSLYGGAKR